jgi:hypothetical protein
MTGWRGRLDEQLFSLLLYVFRDTPMLHPLVSDVHSLVLVTEEIEGFRGFDAFMRMVGMRMKEGD